MTAQAGGEDRLEMLSQLWYMAADGYDADGRSLSLLEDALDDPDPRVAELAGRALRDLENLASSSEQSPELADEVAVSE